MEIGFHKEKKEVLSRAKATFDLDDKVQILELKCPGRITAIWIGKTGVKYLVRYFSYADPKEEYFYPDELKEF